VIGKPDTYSLTSDQWIKQWNDQICVTHRDSLVLYLRITPEILDKLISKRLISLGEGERIQGGSCSTQSEINRRFLTELGCKSYHQSCVVPKILREVGRDSLASWFENMLSKASSKDYIFETL
jgi:hypothetical protein